MNKGLGASGVLAVAAVMLVFSQGVGAQKTSASDLAAKLSGTWVLNRELSTGFRAPAPGRRGGGGGPLFAVAGMADQITEKIVITASAETVTFADARGERTFTVNDKSTKIDVGGSPVNVKSKWDKDVLRQEFSNTQAKLIETWGLDEAGRLVLTAKVESMTLQTPEQKAVFDKQ
jgi:hypothetical protein